MKQANLEQSLSALMDGQADDLELQRILQRVDEPEVRASWQRMQLARSVLRQEDFMPQADLSQRISQALEGEQQHKTKAVSNWSRMAVAASVTLAVLVGAKLVLEQPQTTARPAMASVESGQVLSGLNNPVVLASYGASSQPRVTAQTRDSSELWYRQQLPEYLQQHNSYSGAAGIEAGLPYARAASFKGR